MQKKNEDYTHVWTVSYRNFFLECPGAVLSADIVLVLDESSSVDGDEFQEQQNWMKKLFENFRLVKSFCIYFKLDLGQLSSSRGQSTKIKRRITKLIKKRTFATT